MDGLLGIVARPVGSHNNKYTLTPSSEWNCH